MVPRAHIIELFTKRFGHAPIQVLRLAADGSARTYYRLVGSDGESAIGAAGDDHAENRAFLSFSRSLRSAGLNVPEVYGQDEEAGVWLLQDLGDTTLFSALTEARRSTGEPFPSEVESRFRQVVEALPSLQVEGGKVIDFSVAYPRSDFDEQSILWDLNYFKYHFLKLAEVPFNEARLEEDFQKLTDFAAGAEADHFLHRDLQSRNVMLSEGQPWFIDYQGGRRGALQYDVASLLYSATTAIPGSARERLLEAYLDSLESRLPVDRDRWREHYRGFVLIRLMQAMGAYGYRGFFQRRPRFISSLPTAAKTLAELLEEGPPLLFSELEGVFEGIVDRWGDEAGSLTAEPFIAEPPATEPQHQTRPDSVLIVRITSFSFKEGYPAQADEHGGGFVLDCRSLPNPGREERYRELTGLDAQVVEYLEERPEVETFWSNSLPLVEAHIRDYLERSFHSLSVAFGCTGGQHRSVYFAERLGRHLERVFPECEVVVTHRERSRWPIPSGGARWTP